MGKLYIGNTFIDTIGELKIGSSNVQKVYAGSVLVFPSTIVPPTGTKDTSFNVGTGFNNDVYATRLDYSGKVYAGGFFTSYNSSSQKALIRLSSNGSKDTAFDTGTGFAGLSTAIIYAINQDSNGKIYAGGVFTSYNGSSQNGLIRLNADGTKDTSFNIGTGFDNEVYSVEIDSSGKILVGGLFSFFNGSSQNSIIRLNTDGTKDTSFNVGSGFNAQVHEIKVDSNGKILVGGNFTTFDGSSQTRLIRLNSDGTKDTSFNVGTGCDGAVKMINIDSSGKILVGGFFTTYNSSSQNRLIKLNTDGTKDTSLNIGSGFNGSVESLVFDSNGKLVTGGSFSSYNGSGQNGLIRLNTDGTKDTTLDIGTGFDSAVNSISIQSDGKIIAGGAFTTYKGSSQNRFIRIS